MSPLDDLRSIYPYAFPSIDSFERLMNHFLWEKDKATLEEKIGQAEQVLASWEDHHRQISLGSVWPHQIPHPSFRLVRSLVFNQAISTKKAEKLAASEYLSQLSSLVVDQSCVGEEETAILLSSPFLSQLRRVEFRGNRHNNQAIYIDGLLSSPHLPNLTHISASSHKTGFSYSQLEQLSEANLPSLVSLTCSAAPADNPDWVELFTRDNSFRTLEELVLESVHLGDKVAQTFLRRVALPRLLWLTLSSTGITDVGMRAFADGCSLPQLAGLSLDGTYFGPQGARELAESPCLAALIDLKLRWCDLSDDSLIALTHSPYLKQLESLDLFRNRLGSKGIKALAASPNFGSLRILNINDNQVGDEGMIALVESPYMQNLTTLSFTGNISIRTRGWEVLAQSPMAAFFKESPMFLDGQLEQARLLGMAPHMPSARRKGYLGILSKAELSDIAATYQLKGRSKMKKEVLIDALSRHIAPAPSTQPEESPIEQDDTLFPKLRKLLTYTPSVGVFDQIMWLFSQWEEPESRELGLAYAEEHLASWDDALRVCEGFQYWRGFPVEPAHPGFQLVRHLNVDGYELRGALRLQPLDSYPHTSALKTITSICVTSQMSGASHDAWKILAPSTHLGSLVSLELIDNLLDVMFVPEDFGFAPLKKLVLRFTTGTQNAIEALAQSKTQGIENFQLFLAQRLEPDAFLPLFGSSLLRDVKELVLPHFTLTEQGEEQFRRCEPLASLEVLGLSSEYEEGKHDLLVGPFSAGLQSLKLSLEGQEDDILLALGTLPKLSGLSRLHFHYIKPSIEGARALASASFAPYLRSLVFWLVDLNDQMFQALFEPSTLTSLEALSFSAVETLSSKAMKCLAQTPSMKSLQELTLPKSMGKEGFEHLAASSHLGCLRKLDCNSAKVSALKPLLESPLAQQLVELDCSSCDSSDKIVEILSQGPFEKLEHLKLGYHLSKSGLKMLSQCQFGALRTLRFHQTLERDHVIFDILSHAPYFSHLDDIVFRHGGSLSQMHGLSLASAERFAACERREPFSTFPSTNDKKIDPEVAKIMGMTKNLHPLVRRTYLQVLGKKRLQQIAREAGGKGLSKMSKEELVERLAHHDT